MQRIDDRAIPEKHPFYSPLSYYCLWSALFGIFCSTPSHGEPREVRVGVYANEPKIFPGENGQATGILGDLLTEISRREGWTLKPVQCVWIQCLQALQTGRIDLLPDLAYTEQRAQIFDFHKVPAFYSWSEIYHTNSYKINTLRDLHAKRVAILKDSIQEEYLRELLASFDIHAEFISVKSLDEGFEKVAAGKADAAVANHFFGDLKAPHYQLLASPIMIQPVQLFFGTSRGTNADLLFAIDRNLEAWRIQPDSPYFKILEKWVDLPPPRIGVPLWLWWCLGALVTLFLATLLGGAILRRQVREKTIHLQKGKDELEQSEARYRNLSENSSDWIWAIDLAGNYSYSNSRVQEFLGLDPKALMTSNALNLIHPEDQALFAKNFQYAKDMQSGWHDLRVRWRSCDGGYLTLESNAAPLFDAQERLIGFQGVDRDITERNRSGETLRESEERLRLAQEAAHQGWFDVDLNSGKVTVSPNYAHIIGYDPDEFRSDMKNWLEHVHPADRQALNEAFLKCIEDGGPHIMEYRRLTKTGDWIWIRSIGKIVRWDAEQRPTRMIGMHADITERKLAEEQLHIAASVFTHAREGIVISDAEGMIIDVNEMFTRITGYSREDAVGRNPRLLESDQLAPEYRAEMWLKLKEQGHWSGEIWSRRKNDEVFAAMLTISAVHNDKGHVLRYVSLFSDITPIKEHEQKLQYIAHYDALTGLPNRVLFADRLHQAMLHSQRGEQRLAVVYLDLDGFKAINDSHGHSVGDQLLAAVAIRMKRVMREDDTLARLGGDEFVAVLLDLAEIDASVTMLTRLLAAAAEPTPIGDLTLQVSASVGVTFYPQTEDADADQLLRQADQAMYQAKLAGKNRYHVFDSLHDRSLRIHHESLEHIRRALAAREFVLHYQPKVNMRKGAVMGVEALIRWQHPDRGLLPPSMFLPVIEDHPLAVELGEWVIDTVLSQMELWLAAGLSLPVSVNVGARQLQQSDFVERLGTLLAAHPGINPSHLELEVLETSALQDVTRISQVFNACRKLGVMFALDDFGTGYSSLTYLKRLPAHTLKIDQSFVRGMLTDSDDLAILEAILGLSSAFHRQVIAEGVETAEHGAALLQLGCELAQGYGIAEPMPAVNIQNWIRNWQPHAAWLQIPHPHDKPSGI